MHYNVRWNKDILFEVGQSTQGLLRRCQTRTWEFRPWGRRPWFDGCQCRPRRCRHSCRDKIQVGHWERYLFQRPSSRKCRVGHTAAASNSCCWLSPQYRCCSKTSLRRKTVRSCSSSGDGWRRKKDEGQMSEGGSESSEVQRSTDGERVRARELGTWLSSSTAWLGMNNGELWNRYGAKNRSQRQKVHRNWKLFHTMIVTQKSTLTVQTAVSCTATNAQKPTFTLLVVYWAYSADR